jgi:hypothetical protein
MKDLHPPPQLRRCDFATEVVNRERAQRLFPKAIHFDRKFRHDACGNRFHLHSELCNFRNSDFLMFVRNQSRDPIFVFPNLHFLYKIQNWNDQRTNDQRPQQPKATTPGRQQPSPPAPTNTRLAN